MASNVVRSECEKCICNNTFTLALTNCTIFCFDSSRNFLNEVSTFLCYSSSQPPTNSKTTDQNCRPYTMKSCWPANLQQLFVLQLKTLKTFDCCKTQTEYVLNANTENAENCQQMLHKQQCWKWHWSWSSCFCRQPKLCKTFALKLSFWTIPYAAHMCMHKHSTTGAYPHVWGIKAQLEGIVKERHFIEVVVVGVIVVSKLELTFCCLLSYMQRQFQKLFNCTFRVVFPNEWLANICT